MQLLRPAKVIALAALLLGPGVTAPAWIARYELGATPNPPAGSVTNPVPSASCPITHPPAPPFVPPKPYPREPGPGAFWFGSEKLWTVLYNEGKWGWAPHRPGHENDLTQKLTWWRKGFNPRMGGRPPLGVTGKRLDGAAPPLDVSSASPSYHEAWKTFLIMGVYVPEPGCWEFTGDYHEDKLTFVVRVGP
jgi:hypothetical protein